MVANIHWDLLLFFDCLFLRLLFQRFGLRQIFLQQRKQDRVEHNRQNRTCQYLVLPGLRQQIQLHAQSRQDKRELTNLRQAGGDS